MSQSEQRLDIHCADVSREMGENLYGTAPAVRTWLLLEYDQPWEAKAVTQNDLPPAVQARLNAHLDAIPESRLLLIRQQPRTDTPGLAFFVVRACADDPALYAFRLDAYDDLLAIDVPALAAGDDVYPAHQDDEPLFLVCTNGKRDKCCALYGLPVYQALQAEEGPRVWQSTHVSGHRFAGNMVCFPHGLYYGRIFPADAAPLTAAYRAGQVNPAFFRGRACDPPEVQAAEYFARRETGLTALDALRPIEAAPVDDSTWRVRFAGPDQTQHVIDLTADREVSGIYKSCTDDEVCSVPQYRLVQHTAIP